jgi:hypothetical protein
VKDHGRIEELLAGYALLALEGDDADEADQLLSEHVPSCPTCREMLAGFRAVTGELALATPPVPPPDLTLARIRRELGHEPVRRRRRAGMVALAASVAALVGMAGLSVSLGSRATRAEEQRGTALALLNAMQQPGTDPVALEGSTDGMVEISGPDLERMYLYGRDIPDPDPGNAYQLWDSSSWSSRLTRRSTTRCSSRRSESARPRPFRRSSRATRGAPPSEPAGYPTDRATRRSAMLPDAPAVTP